MTTQETVDRNHEPDAATNSAKGALAAGGLLGALLASSCCVLPLALVTLGLGGTWIGSLTALEPLRPYVLAVTAVILGAGVWQVHLRRRPDCAGTETCAPRPARRLTKAVLWGAILLFTLSATVDLWAPLFY